MNFLQLAQRVAREAGVSGSGPATVTGQTGEAGRVVNWTASAYEDLQLARPNWYWMRADFSFVMTVSQRAYAPTDAGIVSRFGIWDTKSLRIKKLSATDEIAIDFMPYEDFRQSYMIGQQTPSKPLAFTIDPQLRLLFGPIPDYAYTITGEYFKSVQTLSASSDVPEMPDQFHMAIVYRALMMYARFESAGEIYDDAKENYKRLISRIEMNQMSSVDANEPLI